MPQMVKMYKIGEEVLIKAKITDIVVENGELKYKIKAEHSNNDLDHNFIIKHYSIDRHSCNFVFNRSTSCWRILLFYRFTQQRKR